MVSFYSSLIITYMFWIVCCHCSSQSWNNQILFLVRNEIKTQTRQTRQYSYQGVKCYYCCIVTGGSCGNHIYLFYIVWDVILVYISFHFLFVPCEIIVIHLIRFLVHITFYSLFPRNYFLAICFYVDTIWCKLSIRRFLTHIHHWESM